MKNNNTMQEETLEQEKSAPLTEKAVSKEETETSDENAFLKEAATEDFQTNLKRQIDALEQEKALLHDNLLRALAETENVRRRGQREKEEATKYALHHFAKDLVGVADNLRRALMTVEAAKEGVAGLTSTTIESVLEGVSMTENTLLSAFEKHGLRKVNSLHEPFDHTYHQAMFELETDEIAPGTVAQVLQDGYVLHDRLVRPALVGVAKKKP